MSNHRRLLHGILGLAPLVREQLSHLHVTSGPAPTVSGYRYEDTEPTLKQAPLDPTVSVSDQLDELESSGIVGGLRREELPGATGVRVELWSATPKERATWLKRMEATTTEPARSLLAAGGDLRLAQLRRDQALATVINRARDVDTDGMPRRTIAALAQISPQTLYRGLDESAPAEELLDLTPAPAPSTPRTGETEAAGAPTATATTTSSAPVSSPRPAESDARVRMPVGRQAPCVVCSTPAHHTLDGHPLHGGECLRAFSERGQTSPADAPTTPSPGPSPARPAEPPTPDGGGEAATVPLTPTRQRPAQPAAKPKPRPSDRFTGLIAGLNATEVFLPVGNREEWSARHLGDIAELTTRYRLGSQGARRTQAGEIWLWPGALQRLGLPVELQLESRGTWEERRAEREAILQPLNDTPAVAEATADGWVIGQGWLSARTRIKHPRLLPHGAVLVIPTWNDITGMPVLVKGQQGQDAMTLAGPATVVDRVNELAQWTGVGFRLTPGVTGLDMIDHYRPPRRDGDPMRDRNRPAAVLRDQPAELPHWLSERDARLTSIERNFSHWRQMKNLSQAEQQMRYVHAYDHRSHFLNVWSSTLLGIEGLEHHAGDAARWDGSEKPGYFLLEGQDWATWWQDWRLPDPLNATAGLVENHEGPHPHRWVTSHTLKQLLKIDEHLPDAVTILESYTWTESVKYLDKAGKALTEGREAASPEVAATIKMIYAATTQKFAQLDGKPVLHLWRPDWTDHLIAASRTAIISELLTMQRRAGQPDAPDTSPHALVIDRDTIFLASNDPNPETAWIGNPDKLNSLKGGWRPSYSALLEEWAPEALDGDCSSRTWDYEAHTNRMSAPGSVS